MSIILLDQLIADPLCFLDEISRDFEFSGKYHQVYDCMLCV